MSYLQPNEQKLYDTAKAALPRWMFSGDTNAQELVAAFAKQYATVWAQADFWCDQIFITRAFGLWLDQHAVDLGTHRQGGETDAALVARLRNIEDKVTLPSLRTTVDGILAAFGLGPCAIMELRRHAHFHLVGTAYRTFFARGYRMARSAARTIIVILPYTTSASAQAAVAEALNLKKAGGIIVRIEVRANP
jgi:hypothetical protein